MILDHDASNRPLSPRAQAASTPLQHTPHPSKQLDPDPATSPSNPEPRSKARGSRSVDHEPMSLDLGPRTMVQGSGKVAGKVLTIDL